MRSAGELGKNEWLDELLEQLTASHAECRFWTAWSAALFGYEPAAEVLWRFVADGPHRQLACNLAVRMLGAAEGRRRLEVLASDPEQVRTVVLGTGALGDPSLIPWLIGQMSEPTYARAAGEAFTLITGIALDEAGLTASAPEEFHAGPTEDPDDENVTLDPDERLAWPDPETVEQWWQANGSDYRGGSRYLMGRPISHEPSLQQILKTARQRQRAAAAVELALRDPARPLFEVKACGRLQRRRLN